MTGRRSIRTWDERLSRALQFVPGHVGGRVASAQPIRRRGGTLRQASVGAAYVSLYVDDRSTGIRDDATMNVNLPSGLVAGDTLVAVGYIGCGDGLTAPTGWTTLDSGTGTGKVSWVVAHITYTGTAPSLTFTNTSSGTHYGHVTIHAFRGTGLTPGVVAAESTGTSANLPAVSGRWPWQVVAFGSGGTTYTWTDPALYGHTSANGGASGVMSYYRTSSPWLYDQAVQPAPTTAACTSSVSGDWLALALHV